MAVPWAEALALPREVAVTETPPLALMVPPVSVAVTVGVTRLVAEAAAPEARSDPEAAVASELAMLSSQAVTDTLPAWAWPVSPTVPSRWALVMPSAVALDLVTPMPARPPNAPEKGEEVARLLERA